MADLYYKTCGQCQNGPFDCLAYETDYICLDCFAKLHPEAANQEGGAVDMVIIQKSYEGIRDQDGWETLELTVRDAHSIGMADDILTRLHETGPWLDDPHEDWNPEIPIEWL